MAGRASSGTNNGGGNSGGLGAWLLDRLRGRQRREPRLALLERISLAPRQSLALIEAEGRRILVATSPEGGPAFYALDGNRGSRMQAEADRVAHGRARASW
jgi:flagellar biogenesis protein FliO